MTPDPMSVQRWSPEGLAGLTLGLLALALVTMVVVGAIRPVRYLVGSVGAAMVLQTFHASEHLVQAGYWMLHPFARAYMTPWADAASRGFSAWTSDVGGRGMPMPRGMEALHLAMNLIFLSGSVAMLVLVVRSRERRPLRSCRQLTVVQGLHTIEHGLLTVTLYTGGTARGLSTFFGAIPPTSAGAVGYRVFFHFTINMVGLFLAVRAARELDRAGVVGWMRPSRRVRGVLARS